jgi:thioredoxin-related protein
VVRLVLALFVALAGAAAYAQGGAPSPHAIEIPAWFTESFLDFREDVRDAARENKRLMLYFGQDGCPYCKALMKVNFGDPQIVAATRKHLVAIALNLWGDREVTWIDGRKMSEKELARELKVQYTPTLLFLGEKGELVLRLNGYQPPDKFRMALDYVGGREEKRLPYTDFVARRTATKLAAARAAEPFIEQGPVDFPRLLASGGKPVLVLLEGSGCAECAELHRDGFTQPEVRELLSRFRVVSVDVSGEGKVTTPEGRATTERRWARSLNVIYTPTLVFLDRDGREVFRADGYLKPFHLAATLDYVASGAYREEPSLQRFIQKRADTLRAQGKAVDLWN